MAARLGQSQFQTLIDRVNKEPEFNEEYGQAEGRARRAVFVFGFTFLFAGAAAAITLLGFTGDVAERAVEGFLSLIELMIIFYLSTTTIDRSEVLTNVGKGIRARAEKPQIVVQTPEQALAATTTVQTTSPVVVGGGPNPESGDDQVVG